VTIANTKVTDPTGTGGSERLIWAGTVAIGGNLDIVSSLAK
jgi:hypothetical protein